MLTVALLVGALILLSAMTLAMCADEAEDNDQQQSSSNSTKKKPRKTTTTQAKPKVLSKKSSQVNSKVQSKMQSKVQSTVKPGGNVAPLSKLQPKKAPAPSAKESLVSGVSEVKSGGADYYATLIKQCTVKSVSQYGMPPPPPPR